MKRLFATLLSTSGMCATLTWALAFAQIPTVGEQEVQVQKPDAPAHKKNAALFEAMKKEMIEVVRRQVAQPRSEAVKKQGIQAAVKKAPTLPPMPRLLQQAVRPGIRVAPAQIVRMNRDAQVQRLTQQIRPILRAEYHIVRVACRLTPEQRKGIARAAEQALRDAARQYMEPMQRPMTVAQRAANDPRKLIQEALARAVKAELPAEQAARYEEEIAQRIAGRKQLVVRNLVARLDRDLILSAQQRDRLCESLSSHWDDSWCQSLQSFLFSRALPPIPDQYVVPILNEMQKKVWRSTPRSQVFFGGFDIVGGAIVDDPLEDEELREARLAAAKHDPIAHQPAPARMVEMMKIEMMENTRRKDRPKEEKAKTP